ncbi:AraC family transcriptional activator of pobA [Xanthomonas sacchari]|uniref:helix-turn-helix domain-containing protein n=1 Tax=Xanthomonas sacchari TaxID=56458 RepID=UPI00277FF15E|nr:helix-turn-helix domain-containing protein [Xanthomonas sacchari]MDQ1091424.1 AraC family transcriptional activator of pobA [Xanthomonas sacchari]
MPRTASAAVTSPVTVPAFRLYGETGDRETPDLLHWESIAARSRLHDWHIRPHRHDDLLQLLYLQRGSAGLHLDGTQQRLRGPCLLLLPPLCVHGFRFQRNVRGHIVTVSAPLRQRLAAQWPSLDEALARPACLPADDQHPMLDACFAAIASEHAQRRPGREPMLQALATQVLLWAARGALAQAHADPHDADRGTRHLRAYTALIDAHYREHWPLARYADRLGLSRSHLNALCRRLAGASALELLQRRIMLEARRSLVYTTLTVQQLATVLGYADAAYFSRCFRRHAGCSPIQFRQRSQQSGNPSSQAR